MTANEEIDSTKLRETNHRGKRCEILNHVEMFLERAEKARGWREG
jgi:hypothetical protein